MDSWRFVMNAKIGAYEAKTKLPQLLRNVKAGKAYTITHRGEAIADLVPSTAKTRKDVAVAIGALRNFKLSRAGHRVNIKTLIGRGRR
jgi:antitoxin (DNA-binding transcriptional repressor) of toxin-antitoxin stability system